MDNVLHLCSHSNTLCLVPQIKGFASSFTHLSSYSTLPPSVKKRHSNQRLRLSNSPLFQPLILISSKIDEFHPHSQQQTLTSNSLGISRTKRKRRRKAGATKWSFKHFVVGFLKSRKAKQGLLQSLPLEHQDSMVLLKVVKKVFLCSNVKFWKNIINYTKELLINTNGGFHGFKNDFNRSNFIYIPLNGCLHDTRFVTLLNITLERLNTHQEQFQSMIHCTRFFIQ